MARTIAEIKESITTDFMRNPDVARAYGFDVETPFTSHFSKLSIESLLFYIVACATWALECLFDRYKEEVEARIEAAIPHRHKRYRDKVLTLMKDNVLIADTDIYDTSDMTEGDIEAARVVKYAAATESSDASLLTVKVAGETNGKRCPLDNETETQLCAYIAEIKDAGVRVALVNQTADVFNCEVDIYYDPILLPASVETQCREAIEGYIENLPFNGEYTNMALSSRLQAVEGVRIVQVNKATAKISGESTLTAINVRHTPAAGYFSAGEIVVNMKPYN